MNEEPSTDKKRKQAHPDSGKARKKRRPDPGDLRPEKERQQHNNDTRSPREESK